MKKIYLTSILTITLAIPAFANNIQPNIAANAESADCTQPVLGTTTGTSNLQASWTPNTLNIDWYNGETKLTSNTCTYDSGITVPSTNPSKEGYTFAGWKVKTAAAPQQQTLFDLSTLNASIYSIDIGYISDSASIYGTNSYNTDTYGLTEDNTWATEFSYGTVYGEAYCSGKSGNNHSYAWGGNSSDWTATESELITAVNEDKEEKENEESNCWCKSIYYTPLNNSKQSVTSSYWIFLEESNIEDCLHDCANICADYMGLYVNFRRAMFGITE